MADGRDGKRSRVRALALVAVGAVTLTVLLAPSPGSASRPTARTLRIEASSFAYDPAVLEVEPGDTVEIELVATDVVHGLYLEGYDLALTADPGQTARYAFVADRPGTFRFYCSVTCGPLHPFMSGRLKVGENALLWRAVGLALLAGAAVLLVRFR